MILFHATKNTPFTRSHNCLFLLNAFKYIFGFSFVVWRWFFFTLLSHTSTPLSQFSFIDLEQAAVFVPAWCQYFFDTILKCVFKQIISFVCQVECKRAQPKEVMHALQGRGRAGPYFGGMYQGSKIPFTQMKRLIKIVHQQTESFC